MKLRLIPLVLSLVTAPVLAHEVRGGDPIPPATNKDGSPVTGVITPIYNPSAGITGLPIPTNLVFLDSKDVTLNVPVADPDDKGDPLVALSSLDGFSPTEPWVANFKDNDDGPVSFDPSTIVAGQTVRMLEVTNLPGNPVAVTGVVRELVGGVDFIAVPSGSSIAVVPLVPLDQITNYMVIITNGVTDSLGNNATPDQTFHLSQSDTPWVDDEGNSTYELVDDATAALLEDLRQITKTMELQAELVGIPHEDIVLAWTAQTMSVSVTLGLMRSITQPAPVQALPSGMSTAAIGGRGFADIIIGIITLPYYHGIPSEQNPFAPLTENWEATPGAYVPPFDQFGLDPTSTNITYANPFPAPTGMVTVPFIMGVPSAATGITKPEGGWPTVIYAHGITRNRTDSLFLMDSVAASGHALIAMDHPMHGVVPEVEPLIEAFKIDNHPVFGDLAQERTFDVDFFNNETQQFGPDGIPDRSGQSYFNIGNLQAARDNLRQSQVDLFVLASSIGGISVDGDATPDLKPFDMGMIAHSYGGFIGVPFLALEPLVNRAYLNATGALLLRTGEAGAFGELIRALLAGNGILPGSPEFEQFMLIGQTVIGSADAASYAAAAADRVPIVHNIVINDDTVPNFVPGAPMGGNIGLNNLMGLEEYSTTQANPGGLRGTAAFLPPATHSNLFRPTDFLPAFIEMQGQMGSFIGSNGTFVNVIQESLLLPVMAPGELFDPEPVQKPGKGKKRKSGGDPGEVSQLEGARDDRVSRGHAVKRRIK